MMVAPTTAVMVERIEKRIFTDRVRIKMSSIGYGKSTEN